MVFMNFTVSGVGIFTAVKLDEIFRQWQFMDERSILTGHWHILATLTATILLMYYADMAGLKGQGAPMVRLAAHHLFRSGIWCGHHL